MSVIGKSKNGKRVSSAAKLFDERVIRSAGCWSWGGSVNAAGYGVVRVGGRGSPSYLAHRLSWALHCSEIPDGLHVLHRCDNPACSNPDHLFLGTNRDNIADRIAKGRPGSQAWRGAGERHPNARLSNADVAAIRGSRSSGARCVDLARQYGVSARHISAICIGIARV